MWKFLEVKDSGKIDDGFDIPCPEMGHLLLLDDDLVATMHLASLLPQNKL